MSTTHVAGRELDALVAEKVMGGAEMCGFCCPECGGTYFGTVSDGTRMCHEDGCHWNGPASQALPTFSTDIAAAWQVVEHMRTTAPDRYRNLSLVAYCYNRTYASFDAEAICGGGDNDDWSEANGEHATPEAICRAALAAMESR